MSQSLPPQIRSSAQEPLYRQIAHLIAEESSGGRLARGARLPSERELCAHFKVSRVTVRRALAELVEEGVLEPAHGRGWFMTTGVLGEPPNTLRSFAETAQIRGLIATARVLQAESEPATLDEAESFGIAPGAPVFHLRRVRLLDGVPVAFDISRVPLALAPLLTAVDFSRASLYAQLDDGVVPTRADLTVEATAADAMAAKLLEVAEGAPLLVTSQITYDGEGRTIELAVITYRGDRYRHRATLMRPLFPKGEK